MSENNFPNEKIFKTDAVRKRFMRENETPGERALHLEKERERQSSRRLVRFDAKTAMRLENMRKHHELLRQSESEAQSAGVRSTSANTRRSSDKVRLSLNQLRA